MVGDPLVHVEILGPSELIVLDAGEKCAPLIGADKEEHEKDVLH